jgi:homocysteine S-methyltransferase
MGNSIGEPTGFAVGVGLNPAAPDPDREIRLLFRKVEAGARWAQTQPVYDLDALDRFLARLGPPPVPIVVGILPLHSYRHAEFLHNEVPGISVPEDVRRRLGDAGERGLAVGTALARELLRGVRQRCQGAYLIPSFGRFEVVAEILDALR